MDQVGSVGNKLDTMAIRPLLALLWAWALRVLRHPGNWLMR